MSSLSYSTDQATAESTDRDFILIYGSLGILQSLTFLVAVLHMNSLSVNASGLIHRTTLSRDNHHNVTKPNAVNKPKKSGVRISVAVRRAENLNLGLNIVVW